MAALSPSRSLLLLLSVVSLYRVSLGQVNCASYNSSCSTCVSAGSECLWCSTALNTDCLPTTSSSCPAADIVNPRSEVSIPSPLSVEPGANQISVSRVNLKLRVGEPVSFKVSVRAQDNFPLDLYMLMDLSASFVTDLDTVKTIAPNLVAAVRNLTSRFQVGFGAFVDKTTAPFNSLTALRLGFTVNNQSSACSAIPCSRPVSYEHVVNLTNSTDLFDQSVQDLLISTSSDDPEGTLDAMMQAVVCTDVVGWREEARKVLLVMTDDLMHTAGDGRLAGIYQPNDATCHTQLDPTVNRVLYSDSLVYDYPTIEQMRMTLRREQVVPVFAASGEQEYFQNIAQRFNGFSESLDANAANLIGVIEQAYNQLVNSSQLAFPPLDYLDINITASCPDGSTADISNSGCSGIGNNTVNFTVTVTLNRCPPNLQNFGKETITVDVRPAFGSFTLELEGLCSCDCEQTPQINSPSCSNNGNLTCGQCSCDEGWTGDDCSCSTAMCLLINEQQCSGSERGECMCASCQCRTFPSGQRYFGDNCECVNNRCLSGGTECNNRGVCACNGGCNCNTSSITGRRHEGTFCQCNTEECLTPECRINPLPTGCLICSNAGTCSCGRTGSQCNCRDGFLGEQCQVNSGGQRTCTVDRNCVRCYAQASRAGVEPNTICPGLVCTGYVALPSTGNYDNYMIPNTFNTTHMRCPDFDGECTYTHVEAVSQTTEQRVFHVLPVSCLPLPSWGIALVILFALLIFGLLVLICVKLIYVWLDYREVRRLRLEVQNTKFTTYQSPLYHDPNVTYTNVKYGKEE